MVLTRKQRQGLAKGRQTRMTKKARQKAKMAKARAARKSSKRTKKVRKVVRRTIYANNAQNRALGRVGLTVRNTVCGCQPGKHKNRKHKK